MWTEHATTPEGAVKLLLIAMIEHHKYKNPDAKKMWGMLLPTKGAGGNLLTPDGEVNEKSHFTGVARAGRAIRGVDFAGAIPCSYLGGTPANKYQEDYGRDVQVTRKVEKAPNAVKLFLQSGGKAHPSPSQWKRNKAGYWKVFEYSSLYTQVQPADDPDDF